MIQFPTHSARVYDAKHRQRCIRGCDRDYCLYLVGRHPIRYQTSQGYRLCADRHSAHIGVEVDCTDDLSRSELDSRTNLVPTRPVLLSSEVFRCADQIAIALCKGA